MDKYKRFYGVGIFALATFIMLYIGYNVVNPNIQKLNSLNHQIGKKTVELESKQREKIVVENKIKKIRDSILGSQKKIYAPVDSDLGNDTLFFTLYNDLIEMIHSNNIKIKTLNYSYNPKDDEFVKFGKDVYFVCDINMELISNYVNLGKFIQDIYQYPYYIKINELTIKPYAKDKKVLITNASVRLYAHTSPSEEDEEIIKNNKKK